MIISHGRNSFTSAINLARPVNEWTIPSISTRYVSTSGDTIFLNGAGGWNEIAWWQFTVDKAGEYEFSYDYNIPSIQFWAKTTDVWNHFALYIGSDNPAIWLDSGYLQYYYEKEWNRRGTDIISGVKSAANLQGHKKTILTLPVGTYWIWFPGGVPDDYIAMTFTFTNIVVKKV